MNARPQPLQDAYLGEVKRQAVPVVVYLMNGFQLRGIVKGFDPFTIVLEYETQGAPHLQACCLDDFTRGPVCEPGLFG